MCDAIEWRSVAKKLFPPPRRAAPRRVRRGAETLPTTTTTSGRAGARRAERSGAAAPGPSNGQPLPCGSVAKGVSARAHDDELHDRGDDLEHDVALATSRTRPARAGAPFAADPPAGAPAPANRGASAVTGRERAGHPARRQRGESTCSSTTPSLCRPRPGALAARRGARGGPHSLARAGGGGRSEAEPPPPRRHLARPRARRVTAWRAARPLHGALSIKKRSRDLALARRAGARLARGLARGGCAAGGASPPRPSLGCEWRDGAGVRSRIRKIP